MSGAPPGLLDRARLVVAAPDRAGAGLLLDGWPLVWVDLAGGTVAVNDLRQRAMYGHRTPLRPVTPDQELRLGAVGDELYLLVGDAATVFVTPEPAPSSHAAVRVVESATGRVLADHDVRYRQLPAPRTRGPARAGR